LGPAGVHFFAEETALCQLQSGLGAQLSGVGPTVGDELDVARQLTHEIVQFFERHAERTANMRLPEAATGSHVEKEEIAAMGLVLGPMNHGVLVLFGE